MEISDLKIFLARAQKFLRFIKKRAAKPRPPEGGHSGNTKLERTFMTCHVKNDIHDWPR